MRSLFWKFFTIIWLTMAGTFAFMFGLSGLLQTAPFKQEVVRQKQAYTLDLASRIAEQEGEPGVRRFMAQASTVDDPVKLKVTKLAQFQRCVDRGEQRRRLVGIPDGCLVLEPTDPPVSAFRNVVPKLVLWTGLLVASALAAYWLARYLTHPVDHIKRGLSALASGRFDTRIGADMAGRQDEVAALGHDFDRTAERLQELQEGQQRLFHDVSHEVRSPLSRLQAAIGIARQNPSRTSTMLDRMDREIGRIDGLIGEILELARLTSSTSKDMRLQTLDVMDLLNEILEDARFEGQARGVEVPKNVEGKFVTDVNGDLIYRAIENTVRNAVKYSCGSPVQVQAAIAEDSLRIAVSNQGPMVPDQELESIFQPFARASNNELRDGNGLGLAITKHAFERHGGRVFATNREQGGLTVTLELPRSHNLRAAAPG